MAKFISSSIYKTYLHPPFRVWMRIAVMLFLWSFSMATTKTRDLVWAADLELLTPRPGVTIIARNPETHLVLRQSGTRETLRLRVEKSEAMLEPVVNMEGGEYIYLHFRLPLKPGLNTFTIVPAGRVLELTYQPLKGLLPINMKSFYLFHQEGQLPESCVDCHDLQMAKTIDPVGLKEQTSCADCHKNLFDRYIWKHSTTVNQQCLTCHQQYVKPWRIGFREGRIDDTCLTCHTGKKIWLSSKYRHGTLIGGCTLCHNPHGGGYRYQLWAEGSLMLCVACHSDKGNLVSKGEDRLPYVHGIILGKGCVACHDPHATDEEFMLYKPINELCTSCHPNLAGVKKGHPVAGHPLETSSRQQRPGRELTCAGCHDPHGSVHQRLLVETIRGGRLCSVCHKR